MQSISKRGPIVFTCTLFGIGNVCDTFKSKYNSDRLFLENIYRWMDGMGWMDVIPKVPFNSSTFKISINSILVY